MLVNDGRQPGRVAFAATFALALLAHPAASAGEPSNDGSRVSNVYILNNAGGTVRQFCTADGFITVIHTAYQDANGYVTWGTTLIQGPKTYYLSGGNARVEPGCYTHLIANTAIFGTGVANSTIWFKGYNTTYSYWNGYSSAVQDPTDRSVATPPAEPPAGPYRAATGDPVSTPRGDPFKTQDGDPFSAQNSDPFSSEGSSDADSSSQDITRSPGSDSVRSTAQGTTQEYESNPNAIVDQGNAEAALLRAEGDALARQNAARTAAAQHSRQQQPVAGSPCEQYNNSAAAQRGAGIAC
ncbi:MAG TPA: hypothetical protein VGL58_08525 [Caulobacteraceae bacterium]|jgi:hypothetical protein